MRTIIILMAVGMKVSISCILHGGMRVCIFKLYKSRHLSTSNRYFITWCFTSENLNKVEGKSVMIGYDVLVIGAKKKKKTTYLNHILREYAYYWTLWASISYDLRDVILRECIYC